MTVTKHIAGPDGLTFIGAPPAVTSVWVLHYAIKSADEAGYGRDWARVFSTREHALRWLEGRHRVKWRRSKHNPDYWDGYSDEGAADDPGRFRMRWVLVREHVDSALEEDAGT